MNDLIRRWIDIGNRNLWVSMAVDPPFSENSFTECQTVHDLFDKLSHGDWCLAESFYLGNLCFMNQGSGGFGEWLAIRGEIVFESISFNPVRTPIEWWEKFIRNVKNATDDQLIKCEYTPESTND